MDGPSKLISCVVFALLVTLGGTAISIDQWQNATAPEKVSLIHASNLDPMLKGTLVNLVASSSWEDVDSVISDLRSEVRIRQGLSRTDDLKKEYEEIGELLFMVQTRTREMMRAEFRLEGMVKAALVDLDEPESSAVASVLRKKQAESSQDIEQIQSGMLIIGPRISAANKQFASDYSSISGKFFAGIISTAFGGLIAVVGAVKLFLETKKLRLENRKLALELGNT